ncbi:MAG: ATP-binding protein [Conexivisphaera sp.]
MKCSGVLTSGSVVGVMSECESYSGIGYISADTQVLPGEIFIVEGRAGSCGIVRIDDFRHVNEIISGSTMLMKALVESKDEHLRNLLSRDSYIEAELSLVRSLGDGSPLIPGSRIRKLGELADDDALREFYGISKSEELDYFEYAPLAGSNVNLLLNYNGLPMHVGIFGETGSGKTYNMRYLLRLLTRIKKDNGGVTAFPLILIDANGDYGDLVGGHYDDFRSGSGLGFVTRYVLKDVDGDDDYGRTKKLVMDLNELVTDVSGYASPGELATFILSLKYRDVEKAPPLTESLLQQVLEDPLGLVERARQYAPSRSSGRSSESMPNLDRLHDRLSRIMGKINEDEGVDYNKLLCDRDLLNDLLDVTVKVLRDELGFTQGTSRSVKSAISALYHQVLRKGLISCHDNESTFDKRTIEELWKERGLVIIDLSGDGAPGADPALKQLVVSYVARLLFKYLEENKMKSGRTKYIGLAIEEAQNYIPSSEYPVNAFMTRDILIKLATQGRKFGASLFIVSQRPMFVDKLVISMLNTNFFHRMFHEDVRYVMSASGGLPENLARLIPTLDGGYAIVTGVMNALGKPALVHVPHSRNDWLSDYIGASENVRRAVAQD